MALGTVSILTGVPWAGRRRVENSRTSTADGIEGHNRYATVVRITIELPKADTIITFACDTDSLLGISTVNLFDVLRDSIGPTYSSCGSYRETIERDASIQ